MTSARMCSEVALISRGTREARGSNQSAATVREAHQTHAGTHALSEQDRLIRSLHQDACEAGKTTYTDPESGYTVFTEVAHKKRGRCCGSACRH
ncbi:uncharacterized protein DAT39_020357, partial [Clarias magur]